MKWKVNISTRSPNVFFFVAWRQKILNTSEFSSELLFSKDSKCIYFVKGCWGKSTCSKLHTRCSSLTHSHKRSPEKKQTNNQTKQTKTQTNKSKNKNTIKNQPQFQNFLKMLMFNRMQGAGFLHHFRSCYDRWEQI